MIPTPLSYLRTLPNPLDAVTPIPMGITFPESMNAAVVIYEEDIEKFRDLIFASTSSADLLNRIRIPRNFSADQRMSLLKLFRRCVSLVCDTENTKKITKITTESIVKNYGHTFKPIETLQNQFSQLDNVTIYSLASLLAENDNRGQSGYALTGMFFDWFESHFKGMFSIEGPRGAGRDIELSDVFTDFKGSYPCDFVIRQLFPPRVAAVGFARYDSTRGGSQSDDRTGGNANKVDKAKAYCTITKNNFRIIFLADGPGLAHRDTWEEACTLDGMCSDNVRVTTLKLSPHRITAKWLAG